MTFEVHLLRVYEARKCQKTADNGPFEFLAKRFLVEEHIRIAKFAVEAIFVLLDGVDDGLEVRVAGEDNECCIGLAIDASLVMKHAGLGYVIRSLVAEFFCDSLQRCSLAVFLMRETEDVMQTDSHGGPVNREVRGAEGEQTLSKYGISASIGAIISENTHTRMPRARST